MAGRLGSTIGGATAGAGTGFAVGGPPGAAVGGILGAVGGFFGGKGKKDQIKQLPTQTPQQQAFQNNIFGQLNATGSGVGGNYSQAQNYLGGILSGDSQAYDRFSAPYIQNFEQQILPRLAERYGGLGGGLGGGVQNSSGFGQAIGGAGAGLQAQLASLFANLQQNAAQQATGQYNNLASMGLGTQQFENTYQPGNTGAFGPILAGLSQGVGQGVGMGVGNKIGQYSGNSNGWGFGDNSGQATWGNYNGEIF